MLDWVACKNHKISSVPSQALIENLIFPFIIDTAHIRPSCENKIGFGSKRWSKDGIYSSESRICTLDFLFKTVGESVVVSMPSAF